jgi:hypothetical protein
MASFGLSVTFDERVQGDLGQDPVPVLADLFAAAHEGWSPSELMAAMDSAKLDVLSTAPESPLCSVGRLQPSMACQHFEALHNFWCPIERDAGKQQTRAVLVSARVTCASLGVCDRRGQTLGSKLSRYIDPLNTLWAPSAASDQQALLDACHQTEMFRIVIDLGWRKVVVDRGARHVETLLAALRYSFPGLMVPFCEALPDHGVLLELLALVQRAEPLVSRFLPCLFFFFETNIRQFLAFFSSLGNTIRAQIVADETLFPSATAKPRSSWLPFGWGQAERPADPPMSPGEEMQFVDSNGSQLGSKFKDMFVSSLLLHDVACEVSLNTEALQRAIEAEIAAHQAFSEALVESQEGVLSAEPPWMRCEDSAEGVPSVKQVLVVVSGFVSMVSLLQTQVTLAMVQALAGASTSFFRLALTQRMHMKAGVATAKFVVEKERLMTGKESLAATAAAANPAVVIQMKALYARRRTALRVFLKTLAAEHTAANERLRCPLVVLCRSLLSLHHSMFHAAEPTHHGWTMGGAAPDTHPLMSALLPVPVERLLPETAN